MVFEDSSLTYARARRARQQLAHHLRDLGVGPEAVVGLCVERSLEMVVGLLGILKAGGAYLPLDPDYPPERLAFMLADAGAPVLVTQSALRDRLPRAWHPHRAPRCRLADHRAAAHHRTRPSPLDPHNPAYVIYTSGSTGTPKGVVVTHAAFATSSLAQIELRRDSPSRRLLQFASHQLRRLDLRDLSTAAASGATLVVPAGRAQRRPVALAASIAAQQCHLHADCCRLRRSLLVEPVRGLAGSQTLIVGGEALFDRDVASTLLVDTAPAADQRLRPDRDDGLRDHDVNR